MAAVIGFIATAVAQSGPAKPSEQRPAVPPPDAAKDRKNADELAEAARVLDGPAGNAECVWLGRRVVSLLWRDDVDTALRQLQLYDRFDCPAAHIQSTFRCVLNRGPVDPKAPDSLNSRVHTCWITPPPPLPPTRRGKR